MNELTIFKNEQFGEIRIIEKRLIIEVCKWLQIPYYTVIFSSIYTEI